MSPPLTTFIPTLNDVFYNEFFTALILVDVLLLVVSFRYLDDFGMRPRNSGFVVATILLRRALGIEPWHALTYEATAVCLAVGMLLLERGIERQRVEHLRARGGESAELVQANGESLIGND